MSEIRWNRRELIQAAGGVPVRLHFELARFRTVNLTFALPVSFPAFRRRILNAVNAGSGERAWVKTLPLV